MFHVHALQTLFQSPADDWIVIAKQHCVCAPRELRNERLAKDLDPPQWMPIVKVNLLKTRTSWATPVGIAGRKQWECETQRHGHQRGKGTRPQDPGRGTTRRQRDRTGGDPTHPRGPRHPPHRTRHTPRGKDPAGTRDQGTGPQGGLPRGHPPDPPGRAAHPDPGNTDPTSRTTPNRAPRPPASHINSARIPHNKAGQSNQRQRHPTPERRYNGPTTHHGTAKHGTTR